MNVAELLVRMKLEADNLKRGLSTALANLRSFGTSMTKYVTLPVIAAATGLAALAVKTGRFADELLDLSAATGINTDKLQRFRYAEVAAGTQTDIIAKSVQMFARQMLDLNTYSLDVTQAANAYGVELYDLEGKVRNVEDVHWDLMLAIAAIEDPQERMMAGATAFGRQWEQIAPVVDLGVEALQRFQQQEVISQEKLEMANRFREAFDTIKHTFEMIVMEAGIQLIDTLQQIFDLSPENLTQKVGELRENIEKIAEKIDEWVAKWQELEPETQKFIGQLALILILSGPIITFITTVIGFLSGPAGWIITLGLAEVATMKWREELKRTHDELSGLITIVETIFLPFTTLIGHVQDIIEAFQGGPSAIMSWLDPFNKLEGHVRSVMEWIEKLIDKWNEWKGTSGSGSGGSGSFRGDNQYIHYSGYGFDNGGVVPGPIGKAQLALVHGGETILPTHKTGQNYNTNSKTINFSPTIISPEPMSHSEIQRKEKQLLRNLALEWGM